MNSFIYLAPVAGVIALIFAFYKAMTINKSEAGNDRMKEIASAIAEGARAFLFAEYKVLVIFVAVLFVVLGFGISWLTAVCFLVGALFSTLAGYFGMTVATKANVRTANAAKESGMNKALSIAFSGGAVMGLSVVGLGIIGISVIFIILNATGEVTTDAVSILTGFSLGASSIALFARVGGGIYTKAADVGADLVGKVEAGIPEDDPRNPAVIADNVGDNVGDVAGMGFKGKVIKPNSSYKEMLDAFSKDLNWDSQSLSKITGECLISNANYHPIKYMIFMWFVIVIMLISLKNIVEAIMGIVNPYLYPVCTFLNKQLGKEYIDDAESELSFGNYIQINSIYITENYCIDLGKNKISILPLNDIVWCYRLGNISLNPKSEEPTFSLHFTLIDGSTILFKKKTSDEALEAINAIRATEYNIIIGHSESKKKAAKAVINSYKQK